MLKLSGKNGKERQKEVGDPVHPDLGASQSPAQRNTRRPRRPFRNLSYSSPPRDSGSSGPKRPTIQHRSTTSGGYPTGDPQAGPAYLGRETSQSSPARSPPSCSLPPSPRRNNLESHELRLASSGLSPSQDLLPLPLPHQPAISDPKDFGSPPSRPPPPPPIG
ncbi:MAG: hypothetical protein L6R42_003397 [Xanthoria sp. 1 TBL-2021]|nr:MAG: hypothetical protein L6R42_003397 [Xanthoria sp. 1 TBL-2021]